MKLDSTEFLRLTEGIHIKLAVLTAANTQNWNIEIDYLSCPTGIEPLICRGGRRPLFFDCEREILVSLGVKMGVGQACYVFIRNFEIIYFEHC